MWKIRLGEPLNKTIGLDATQMRKVPVISEGDRVYVVSNNDYFGAEGVVEAWDDLLSLWKVRFVDGGML